MPRGVYVRTEEIKENTRKIAIKQFSDPEQIKIRLGNKNASKNQNLSSEKEKRRLKSFNKILSDGSSYPSIPSLCLCGCNEITWNGKEYIHGHHTKIKEFRIEQSKRKIGKDAWNKGLTKETDPRVKNNGKKIREHYGHDENYTSLNREIRECFKMKEWRDEVFKRDNYICQECHNKDCNFIQAHHMKPFNLILKNSKIKTFQEALLCFELWNISNGITLGIECHKHIHNIAGNIY